MSGDTQTNHTVMYFWVRGRTHLHTVQHATGCTPRRRDYFAFNPDELRSVLFRVVCRHSPENLLVMDPFLTLCVASPIVCEEPPFRVVSFGGVLIYYVTKSPTVIIY